MAAPVSPWKLVATALYLAAFPALMLLLAGDWRWPQGWIFGGWLVGISAWTVGWLYVKDPALLAERYRRPGSGGQSWTDQAIVYLIGIGFVAWIALMPLDARRFHWTPRLPLALALAGGALLIPAALFLFRALADNTFASPLVRVQAEREQRVVSTGVYGIVRHPVYLGALCMFVGAPLLTGAASALVVALLVVVVLVVRIRGEEKLLVAQLPGYDDYRRRVRYRLVPGIW